MRPSSYWLTRFVILRLLGFVYFIAFLVAVNQIVPLVGEHGLLPAKHFLERVTAHVGSRSGGFLLLPSIFWLNASDSFLMCMAWVGLALSAVVTLGYANAIIMSVLWALYMSFIHIGQDWYGYGWEIQLLETGFLAIFLCPVVDSRPFSKHPPPVLVIWLYRWLIFRIMFGAGLIKLRGDTCWRDLTCLYYHYETQPIPNPLSWWLHFRPHWFHKFGVLWNDFIELVVPWFAFGPRVARHIAGVLLVSFQVVLILSGNLSFLNWLTIVPALACFDDSFLKRFFPRRLTQTFLPAPVSDTAAPPGSIPSPSRTSVPTEWATWIFGTGPLVQRIPPIALSILVGVLSISPVTNMLSSHQIMNTSFNRLHLVNTYGAFGSVGQIRHEIVFEGTTETNLTPQTQWKEYEFKAKPGDPTRRPPLVAPYQPRIDWQIWFAAMSTPEQYPWTLHFVWKLLHNDPGTLSLIAKNPFAEHPPAYIRAQYYRYQFAARGSSDGSWWNRTLEGTWLPPLSKDNPNFRQFLAAYGWRPDEQSR